MTTDKKTYTTMFSLLDETTKEMINKVRKEKHLIAKHKWLSNLDDEKRKEHNAKQKQYQMKYNHAECPVCKKVYSNLPQHKKSKKHIEQENLIKND